MMTPRELKMTRTYYFTWQGLSLAFTALVGGVLYFGISIAERPDFFDGLIIGAVMMKTWSESKWKDGN